jgi:hypothetical protein
MNRITSPSDRSPAADPLARLAAATARYAAYSRSAGGLSLVVGGVLCLAAFVVGAIAPLGPALRWTLAAAPLLWLLSKELLRALYYQRDGAALERLSAKQRRVHRWMVGYLAVVSALILVPLLWMGGLHMLAWPMGAYLVFVAAMPLVAARWFWSTGDFLVGVLLVCQAAVVIGGGHYPWYWILIAAAFAAIAVATGWREHRDYLRLRDELGLDAPRDGHGADA